MHTLKGCSADRFSPFDHKMFNQDIFTYNDGNVEILHSSARCMKVIPGVLVLENFIIGE